MKRFNLNKTCPHCGKIFFSIRMIFSPPFKLNCPDCGLLMKMKINKKATLWLYFSLIIITALTWGTNMFLEEPTKEFGWMIVYFTVVFVVSCYTALLMSNIRKVES